MKAFARYPVKHFNDTFIIFLILNGCKEKFRMKVMLTVAKYDSTDIFGTGFSNINFGFIEK